MRANIFALGLALVLVGTSGCSSCGAGGAGGAKEDLQLVPKETDILLSANLKRMRNTAMWRKLLDTRDESASAKKDMDEFVQKCGLDPFAHIDSAFAAFPHSSPSGEKEFAVILRGTFNEAKLVECARDQAKKDGNELAESEYGGKKLYTSTKSGQQAFATFLDPKTIALGGKEWIKKVVDLAAGKGESAKANEQLTGLIKRTKTADGLWGVGTVPQETRDKLKNDPSLSSAASMKDVFGSVDFAAGLAADLNVDTGADADAQEMVKKITDQITEARKNAQVMMMGLGTFLDGVKVEAKGPTFHATITLNQQQVDDLFNRAKGMLAGMRGNVGGGLGLPQ
jgi:hypothetical protein